MTEEAVAADVSPKKPWLATWRTAYGALAGRFDWRTRAIAYASMMAIAITAVILYLGWFQNPANFWDAVFASWVAGLALFVTGGLVVAFVSIVRPESGAFDSRARILFRGQSGAHINYIVSRMGTVLEQYAVYNERRVVVREYHAGEKKFFVSQKSVTVTRSYIEDMASSVRTKLGISRCVAPPPGGKHPRLAFLRLNGEVIANSRHFDGHLEHEFVVPIPMKGEAKVESETEYWVGTDNDPLTHAPIRYVRRLALTVENLLSVNLRMEVAFLEEDPQEVVVRAGGSREFRPLHDLNPDRRIFSIRLLPLDPDPAAPYIEGRRSGMDHDA